MSRRDPLLAYRHMLEHAQKAVALAQGRTRSDLDTDWVMSLALVRLLEIVGEAASRIAKGEQAQHSQIPWTEVIGLRNRLIHGYDSVDLDILWQIVQQDLPPLITDLQAIVSRAE